MPTPSSLVKLLVAACAPCPSWAVMLLVAVQYEHVYDETPKEMSYEEAIKVYVEVVQGREGNVTFEQVLRL